MKIKNITFICDVDKLTLTNISNIIYKFGDNIILNILQLSKNKDVFNTENIFIKKSNSNKNSWISKSNRYLNFSNINEIKNRFDFEIQEKNKITTVVEFELDYPIENIYNSEQYNKYWNIILKLRYLINPNLNIEFYFFLKNNDKPCHFIKNLNLSESLGIEKILLLNAKDSIGIGNIIKPLQLVLNSSIIYGNKTYPYQTESFVNLMSNNTYNLQLRLEEFNETFEIFGTKIILFYGKDIKLSGTKMKKDIDYISNILNLDKKYIGADKERTRSKEIMEKEFETSKINEINIISNSNCIHKDDIIKILIDEIGKPLCNVTTIPIKINEVKINDIFNSKYFNRTTFIENLSDVLKTYDLKLLISVVPGITFNVALKNIKNLYSSLKLKPEQIELKFNDRIYPGLTLLDLSENFNPDLSFMELYPKVMQKYRIAGPEQHNIDLKKYDEILVTMDLAKLFKRHQVTSNWIDNFNETLIKLEKEYSLENENTKLLNEVQQNAIKSKLIDLKDELMEIGKAIENHKDNIPFNTNKLKLPLAENDKLVLWANQWSGLLGCPIFIVGSQLTDKINPNDVDIVIPMSKKQFEMNFGDMNSWFTESNGNYTEIKWKWWTRCNKIKEDGFNDTGLNLDVKIQPYSQFYGFMSQWKDLKPYRLDHNPDFDTKYFLTTFFNKKKVNDEEISLKAKSDLKVPLNLNTTYIFNPVDLKINEDINFKFLIQQLNYLELDSDQLIDLQKIIVDRLHIITDTSKFKTIPADNNFGDEDKLIELSKENEIKIPVFELVFDKNRNVIYVNDRDKTILRLQKSSKKSIFLSGKSENETFIDGHFDWLNINIKK